MAVIYNADVKDDRMQQVIDAVDAGSGNGKLKIYTAGLAVLLATIVLQKPSFTLNAGVITVAGTPLQDDDAAATGVPAAATITDSDDVVIVSGLTVGTIGTNIILESNHIDQHDEVRMDAGAISHA